MICQIRECVSQFFNAAALKALIIRCDTNIHRYVFTETLCQRTARIRTRFRQKLPVFKLSAFTFDVM